MKNKKMYWTEETHAAIVEYQQTRDEKLFVDKIYPAFKIMARYWCDKFKLDVTEDDVVTHLYTLLPKFNAAKYKNSYAYYGTCAKFFLNSIRKRDMTREKYIDTSNSFRSENIKSIDEVIETDKGYYEMKISMINTEDLKECELLKLKKIIEKFASIPASESKNKKLNNIKTLRHIFANWKVQKKYLPHLDIKIKKKIIDD
jgi:hypothetical protein